MTEAISEPESMEMAAIWLILRLRANQFVDPGLLPPVVPSTVVGVLHTDSHGQVRLLEATCTEGPAQYRPALSAVRMFCESWAGYPIPVS